MTNEYITKNTPEYATSCVAATSVTILRLRAPPRVLEILHEHYDLYKHEVSGGSDAFWLSSQEGCCSPSLWRPQVVRKVLWLFIHKPWVPPKLWTRIRSFHLTLIPSHGWRLCYEVFPTTSWPWTFGFQLFRAAWKLPSTRERKYLQRSFQLLNLLATCTFNVQLRTDKHMVC